MSLVHAAGWWLLSSVVWILVGAAEAAYSSSKGQDREQAIIMGKSTAIFGWIITGVVIAGSVLIRW